MKIELTLTGIKPISLNDSQKSARNGRRYKPAKTLQWESSVNLELRKYKKEFNKFNKSFDEKTQFIIATYKIFHDKVLKKDGSTNKNGGDNSNVVKPLEDLIFKQLHADDSQVHFLYVEKFHSENVRTQIFLQVKDLPKI